MPNRFKILGGDPSRTLDIVKQVQEALQRQQPTTKVGGESMRPAPLPLELSTRPPKSAFEAAPPPRRFADPMQIAKFSREVAPKLVLPHTMKNVGLTSTLILGAEGLRSLLHPGISKPQ